MIRKMVDKKCTPCKVLGNVAYVGISLTIILVIAVGVTFGFQALMNVPVSFSAQGQKIYYGMSGVLLKTTHPFHFTLDNDSGVVYQDDRRLMVKYPTRVEYTRLPLGNYPIYSLTLSPLITTCTPQYSAGKFAVYITVVCDESHLGLTSVLFELARGNITSSEEFDDTNKRSSHCLISPYRGIPNIALAGVSFFIRSSQHYTFRATIYDEVKKEKVYSYTYPLKTIQT